MIKKKKIQPTKKHILKKMSFIFKKVQSGKEYWENEMLNNIKAWLCN